MNTVFERTHELLNKIKDQKNAHKLDLKNFRGLFQEDPGEVSKAIQNCLLQALQVFKRHPQAEKAVRAVVTMLEELLSLFGEPERQQSNDIFRTFTAVFRLLLQGLEARDKVLRHGCAFVMERFCALGIPEAIQMPVVFKQQLENLMVQLLRDKDTQVRIMGAKLAKYSFESEVVNELIRASQQEKSAEVRKQALRSFHLTTDGCIDEELLQAVVERLRDKEESVRLEAWSKVAEVPFAKVSDVERRRRIVVAGMVDRSEKVRDACKLYIKAFLTWFEKEPGIEDVGPHHAPVAFMSLMSIDDLPLEMEQGVSRALTFIIKELLKPDSMIQLIEGDLQPALIAVLRGNSNIQNSHLLLFRYMLQCLKAQETVKTEEHIPDMRTMCELLEHFTRNQEVFKLHQVMCITRCMDLAEEIPKRNLIETLKKVLVEFPVSVDFSSEETYVIQRQYHEIGSGVEFVRTSSQLVDQIAIYLRELLSDHEAEFSRNLIEVINEVRDPLMKPLEQDDPVTQMCEDHQPNLFDKQEYLKIRISQVKEEMEAQETEMEALIQSDKYQEAKQMKERIQELHNTVQSAEAQLAEITETMGVLLMKSLLVTSALLRHCKQDFITDEIVEMINTLVKPSLELERNDIRCVAVECVGLFSLLRKELSTRYLGMFKFVLVQGDSKLLMWYSLKALLDAFLLHDFLSKEDTDVQMKEEPKEVSPSEIYQLLLSFLNFEDENIRALVAEGIAKLLFLKRVPNPEQSLARLLILYSNTKCPHHASQILQMFFLTYPLLSEENTTALEEAFKLAFTLFIALGYRKDKGILDIIDPATINVNKMFEFTFTYTDWDQLVSQAKYKPRRHFHFALFNYFANECLQTTNEDSRHLYLSIACQAKLRQIGSREVYLANWLLDALQPKAVDAKERKLLIKVRDSVKEREAEVTQVNDADFREAQTDAWARSKEKCATFIKSVLDIDFCDLPCGPTRSSHADDPVEMDEDDETPPVKRNPEPENVRPANKKKRTKE